MLYCRYFLVLLARILLTIGLLLYLCAPHYSYTVASLSTCVDVASTMLLAMLEEEINFLAYERSVSHMLIFC